MINQEKQNLINYLKLNPKKEESWYELALRFKIGQGLSKEQRRKRANDYWRRYKKQQIKKYKLNKEDLKKEQKPLKKLFYDIETSPNLVFSWGIGHKVNLSYENIVQERAIICICWKWEGEEKIHCVYWKKGDDKGLLKRFAEIINEADIVIGHNSNSYDNKFLFGRCILHGIKIKNKFKREDTLSMARRLFRFNSNKLDYLGEYLGVGNKIKTNFDLWKKIVLKDDPKAMDEMGYYCAQDVSLLEKVYNKLVEYEKIKVR